MDCLQELPDGVRFIEIKSSATLSTDHLKNMMLMKSLFAKTQDFVVYTGTEEPLFHNVKFINWQNIGQL